MFGIGLLLLIKKIKGKINTIHCLMMMSDKITSKINMVNLIKLSIKKRNLSNIKSYHLQQTFSKIFMLNILICLFNFSRLTVHIIPILHNIIIIIYRLARHIFNFTHTNS
jgi:hypothetical protein